MSCNSFCQDQLPEQLLNDCGATVTGGGDQAIIFACDATTTDFSDEVTIAADIASGKATLFQAIKVNKMPHIEPNNSLDQANEEEINRIFRKATHKNKKERYKTCEAFQLDIIQFI